MLEGLASNGFVVQMMTQTEMFSIKEMKKTNVNPKPSKMRTLEPRPKSKYVELLNMTRAGKSKRCQRSLRENQCNENRSVTL